MVKKQIKESIDLKDKILNDKDFIELIEHVSEICTNVYRNNNKTILAGNGGSAADSQHIAGEFVSRFYFDRPGLASISLTTDTSILTAIGNDYGYDRLFSRQIEANGKKGIYFLRFLHLEIQKNILETLKKAKEKEIITVGLTGNSGGKMKSLCDYCFIVPSSDTPRIQECHILIGHIICSIVENNLFKNK